ncbi:hypothetical protein BpHYR1_021795 [Brachionus plicatilis]|uniref:Uncharacterized protein n=1 Tax=Brachionus plicatilis TaxID=10195 RepID=A0A3M7RN70_BRAPC|nr:hypothetical protein BpHYR1_021795 [Brachionus plicatilis]
MYAEKVQEFMIKIENKSRIELKNTDRYSFEIEMVEASSIDTFKSIFLFFTFMTYLLSFKTKGFYLREDDFVEEINPKSELEAKQAVQNFKSILEKIVITSNRYNGYKVIASYCAWNGYEKQTINHTNKTLNGIRIDLIRTKIFFCCVILANCDVYQFEKNLTSYTFSLHPNSFIKLLNQLKGFCTDS